MLDKYVINRGLFKKSPQVIFFGETNPESLFWQQDGIKKKQEKKDLSRRDSNCKGIQVSFTNQKSLTVPF